MFNLRFGNLRMGILELGRGRDFLGVIKYSICLCGKNLGEGCSQYNGI